MMQHKLLVIGIDGGTWNIIQPLIEADALPNLRRLVEGGGKASLRSTLHPLSPEAWTSFHTGASPWKHGVFDFSSLDINQPFSPMQWDDIQVPSIVELLDRAGVRAIWNNLLGLYPLPELQNGVIVGSFIAPAKRPIIFPQDLQAWVEQVLPKWSEMDTDLSQFIVDGRVSETALLARLLSRIDHQTRLTTCLMETQPWDLCFVSLDATDLGQHVFWRHLDAEHPSHKADPPDHLKQAIGAIYRRTDKSIGELLERASQHTNVLVLSDHGFGPLYATVNLNGFLASAGYTVPMGRYHPSRLLRLISCRLTGTGLAREPVYRNLRVSWKRTTVYAHGYMGNLFVNLKGREPAGCVCSGDYEDVIRAVSEDLHQWKNPVTGAPMIRRLHRSPLPMSEQLRTPGIPDLLVEWFDYRYAGIHPGDFDRDFEIGSPRFSYDLLRSADHTPEGVLIYSGPDFDASASCAQGGKVCISDLAPVIMRLMGLPLPDHFDARVATMLLAPGIADRPDQHRRVETRQDDGVRQTGYSEDELSAIADRLRGLGYLD